MQPNPFIILLIDDDPIFTITVKYVINTLYPTASFISTTNSTNAIDLLTQNTVNLILLDINMPIINGWELITMIPSEFKAIPLYLLSSSIDPSDYMKAMETDRISDYIEKPLTTDNIKIIAELNALES